MPKLSTIPKVFSFAPASEGNPPVLAVVAASEAEAWHYLRYELQALNRATPAESFELGAIGVPLFYAKPEYRDGDQQELPLTQEGAHVQP